MPWQSDHEMVIEVVTSFCTPSFNPADYRSRATNRNLAAFHQSKPDFEHAITVPRSPTPSPTHPAIRFFLTYHKERIIPAHYFRYFDYSEFFTKSLMAMADGSEVLQSAVVAFSALVFSVKVHQRVRPLAFYFYSRALQQLGPILDEAESEKSSFYAAVATALELASFDVRPYLYNADLERYVGDASKVHKHVLGAVRIIQASTPREICSNTIGTNLVELCHQLEHYVCFLGAYQIILPPAWRDENARVRETTRRQEAAGRLDKDRAPILLDYLFPKFYSILPKMGDLLSMIQSLKTMRQDERQETGLRLALQLREFDQNLDEFLHLADVLEVLKPSSSPPVEITLTHISCCPPPIFTPSYFVYPPAAMLRMVVLGVKCYIRAILLPPIIHEIRHNVLGLGSGEEFSLEICRSFAGLEEVSNNENYESFLPLSGSMILATACCPPAVRIWLWCKLVHFEELGHLTFDPMRQSLATLWDMPEIISQKKMSSNYSSVPEILETIQGTLDHIDLDTEEAQKFTEVEEDLSDPVAKGRGLVGLLS